MEFLVKFETHFPDGTPEAEVKDSSVTLLKPHPNNSGPRP